MASCSINRMLKLIQSGLYQFQLTSPQTYRDGDSFSDPYISSMIESMDASEPEISLPALKKLFLVSLTLMVLAEIVLFFQTCWFHIDKEIRDTKTSSFIFWTWLFPFLLQWTEHVIIVQQWSWSFFFPASSFSSPDPLFPILHHHPLPSSSSSYSLLQSRSCMKVQCTAPDVLIHHTLIIIALITMPSFDPVVVPRMVSKHISLFLLHSSISFAIFTNECWI